MSVNELQALTQKFADAFDQRDLQPVMEMLSEILGIILWLPEEYLASRACSATLRLLKVESGINGCLPTAWVPSIYSVSPLSRLRSALEKVSVFCAWKLFARCLAASCQTQKVLGSDLPGSNRAA
jgi:hypothetical protein